MCCVCVVGGLTEQARGQSNPDGNDTLQRTGWGLPMRLMDWYSKLDYETKGAIQMALFWCVVALFMYVFVR